MKKEKLSQIKNLADFSKLCKEFVQEQEKIDNNEHWEFVERFYVNKSFDSQDRQSEHFESDIRIISKHKLVYKESYNSEPMDVFVNIQPVSLFALSNNRFMHDFIKQGGIEEYMKIPIYGVSVFIDRWRDVGDISPWPQTIEEIFIKFREPKKEDFDFAYDYIGETIDLYFD